jgi:SMODS and SLOG-associating 2TM effector domain 2
MIEPTNLPGSDADEVRIARHHQLCSALPFPSLNWSKDSNVESNLTELHDYAVQLANSGIDWYLEKKRGKELRAKAMHVLTYISGILAAIIPLFMIIVPEFEILRGHFGNPREFAAEAALLLIGIAGGFNIIDRSAGYSADWMRYIVTATQLNSLLVQFEFEWNALSRAVLPAQPPPDQKPAVVPNSLPPQAKKSDVAPDEQRIDLVKTFCLKVLNVIGGETEVWANELKERVAQMARNLSQPNRS